jgi:DNA-binding response OmpR family regulator
MQKILVVEDDKNILAGLVDNLKMEGYATVIARDGETALAQVEERKPDLIILDIMLPKLSGFEVCKKLKRQGSAVPIIILSAQGDEADKILGLELGADDYVTKPFSPRELMVRIKAVLRRSHPSAKVENIYEFDKIKVDFKRYQVFRGDAEVKLTSAEFKILQLLLASKGEPVSRHAILGDIWSNEVTTRTVDTHIWNLREKLEDDPSNPKHIVTVHRIGYKFAE